MRKLSFIFFIFFTICAYSQNSTSIISEFSNSINQTQVTYNQIFQKKWYDVEITNGSKNSNAFNPFFLPFKYQNNTGIEDKNQHLTFPSLLSFKFDFVPDTYNSRHPTYIYQRDESSTKLEMTPQEISTLLTYWESTHAIGGEIIEYEDGFTGKMIVYDKSAHIILQKEYLKKSGYFQLMGQMTQDWMNFRKQKISPGLKKELFWDMTKSREIIRLYGKVFDVKRRTNEEWQIYEEILKRDPGFGEVRFWYANQKQWSDGDREKGVENRIKSLEDHLVIPALIEVEEQYCNDKFLKELYKKKLNYAESILPDNIRIISERVIKNKNNLSLKTLNLYLPLAKDNPNQMLFLELLGLKFMEKGMPDKSIPLFISSYQSGFLGTQDFFYIYLKLVYDYTDLGYYSEAEFFSNIALKNPLSNTKNNLFLCKADILRETGRFKESIVYYEKHLLLFSDDNMAKLKLLLVAYEGSQFDRISDLKKKYYDKLTEAEKNLINSREFIFRGDYQKAKNAVSLANKTLHAKKIINMSVEEREIAAVEYMEILLIQTELALLMNDNKSASDYIGWAFFYSPHSRRVSFLLQKCSLNNDALLNPYSYVANILFEDDDYWNNYKFKYESKNVVEDEVTIYRKFKDMVADFDNQPDKKRWLFCRNLTPFYPEFLILQLLNRDSNKYSREILDFYQKYSFEISAISAAQRKHCRIFYFYIISYLPDNQKTEYKNTFNNLLKYY